MKKPFLYSALVLAFFFVGLSKADAQTVLGYSRIDYDDTTKTVYGYSSSTLIYFGGFNYTAYVEGYLYDQYGDLWDSGYDEGDFLAQVFTIAPAIPVTQYTVYSDHYLVARYYTEVIIKEPDGCWPCDGCYTDCYYFYDNFYWWDPYGFGFLNPGYYGPWWYFYGYGPPANLEVEYIYLGTTHASLITPSPRNPQCGNLSVRLSPGFSSNGSEFVEGTTQNGFLGAVVGLQAVVVPSSAGSYTWTTGGNAHKETTPEGNLTNIYWTDEGTHAVVVTFTPSSGGCQISASVNVNEVVPSQFTLTGYEQAPRVRDDCATGLNGFGGVAVSVGCGFDDPGVSFMATAQGPSSFISAPNDAGIKFVQWVSSFATAHDPNTGYLCNTSRSAEGLVDTGWYRDGFDPYNLGQSFVPFSSSGSATLGTLQHPDTSGTGDSPGYGISSFDYFRNHDYFQRYLVYWGGQPASHPNVARPLAVINWNWSSEIFFLSPGIWSSYTTYPPSMPLQATATNSIRTEGPRAVGWASCNASNPTPTPTPDSDPCIRKPWLCQ